MRELSIGDYVLNGGEVATLVMVEAIARLIPGVIGQPHLTGRRIMQPVACWNTRSILAQSVGGVRLNPDLLGGNHKLIARRRRDQALTRTATRRPDMIAAPKPATLDAPTAPC